MKKRIPFFIAKGLIKLENNAIYFDESTMRVKLTGDLDHHAAALIRAQIDDALFTRMPKKLELDVSEVSFMDSSGLGLILGRYTKAVSIGCRLVIKNPAPRLERLIALSGMADKIPIEKDTLQEESTHDR